MNIFILLITLILVAVKVNCRSFENVSLDTPDVILENILDGKMCARQVGVSENTFKNVEDKDGLLPDDNDSFNLFYGCIFKRKGIVDYDGKINVANLRTYLINLFSLNQAIAPSQKKLVESSIQECENINGNNYGQKSVRIHNCIMNKLHNTVKE